MWNIISPSAAGFQRVIQVPPPLVKVVLKGAEGLVLEGGSKLQTLCVCNTKLQTVRVW